jgi:hypothetical protein
MSTQARASTSQSTLRLPPARTFWANIDTSQLSVERRAYSVADEDSNAGAAQQSSSHGRSTRHRRMRWWPAGLVTLKLFDNLRSGRSSPTRASILLGARKRRAFAQKPHQRHRNPPRSGATCTEYDRPRHEPILADECLPRSNGWITPPPGSVALPSEQPRSPYCLARTTGQQLDSTAGA